jgi:hypothetical protein
LGVEIEVLEIACHEAGIRSEDNDLKEKLDGGEVGSFGADIAHILDGIVANGEADMAQVDFSGRKTATTLR